FQQLLPPALQELSWTFRERGVKTVMILSDEPHIPWELIKPYRENPATGEFEEAEFWGQSYALTHWLRGRPPAQRFSFQRIFALAPQKTSEAAPGSEALPARDMVPLARLAPSQAGPSAEPSGSLPASADEELAVLRALEASGSRFQLRPARC